MQSTQTSDAVVIGAGAVGCAVALRLAQHGIIPHVIERDDIAFNASGYAWGGLSAHFGSGVPGPMTKHYRDAIDKHIQHYERVSPEPEFDWQLQRVTSLSLADDETTANNLAADVEWMRSEDFNAELIGPDEIYELEPAIRPGMIAASLANSGWELDSYIYTKALANECETPRSDLRLWHRNKRVDCGRQNQQHQSQLIKHVSIRLSSLPRQDLG